MNFSFNFTPGEIQGVGYGHLAVGFLMAILAGTMGKRPDGSSYPLHVRVTQGLLALSLLMVGYCWLGGGRDLAEWTGVWLTLCGTQGVFVIQMGTRMPTSDSEWLALLKRALPPAVVCLVIIGVEVGLTWTLRMDQFQQVQEKTYVQTQANGRKSDSLGVQLDSTNVKLDSTNRKLERGFDHLGAEHAH